MNAEELRDHLSQFNRRRDRLAELRRLRRADNDVWRMMGEHEPQRTTWRGKGAGKSRVVDGAGFSGESRNMASGSKGGRGNVVDGWRAARPWKGASFGRDGEPLSDPAVNLAWLDWSNRGNPTATGLCLPDAPADEEYTAMACPGLLA